MLEKIVYEQYEEIRMLGVCNMFNRTCVKAHANSFGFDRLVGVILAGNYSELLDTYQVAKREGWI